MSDALEELQARINAGAKTQATTIEQTRAAAWVVAIMSQAKRWPRDPDLARLKMRQAADTIEFADQAFWEFPRAGEKLTGMTVHAARALLTIWGNCWADVVELDRVITDEGGYSEMRAFATDLETNVTFSLTFTADHARDTKRGKVKLAESRDIYENNANLGARRLRECIFALLPGWYKKEAEELARERLRNPDPTKSLQTQISEAVAAFKSRGIDPGRLEAALGGRPRTAWTDYDLGQLRIKHGTLIRGEASADELFPQLAPTSEEILGGATRPAEASTTGPDAQHTPAPDRQAAAEEAPAAGTSEESPDGAMFPQGSSSRGRNSPT